jgi:hypothetical protein
MKQPHAHPEKKSYWCMAVRPGAVLRSAIRTPSGMGTIPPKRIIQENGHFHLSKVISADMAGTDRVNSARSSSA